MSRKRKNKRQNRESTRSHLRQQTAAMLADSERTCFLCGHKIASQPTTMRYDWKNRRNIESHTSCYAHTFEWTDQDWDDYDGGEHLFCENVLKIAAPETRAGWKAVTAKRPINKRKHNPKARRRKPVERKPGERTMICSDCKSVEYVHRWKIIRSSRPRCSRCGGPLNYPNQV